MQFATLYLKLTFLFFAVETILSAKSFLKNNNQINPIDSSIVYISAFKDGIPQRILLFKHYLKQLTFKNKVNSLLPMSLGNFGNHIVFEDPIQFNIETYVPTEIKVFYPPIYSCKDFDNNLLEVQLTNKNVDDDDNLMILSFFFKRNASNLTTNTMINSLKLMYNNSTDSIDISDKEVYNNVKNSMMRYANINNKLKWIGTDVPIDLSSSLFEEIATLSKNNFVHNKIVITDRNSTLFHIYNNEDTIQTDKEETRIINTLNTKFDLQNNPILPIKFKAFPRFRQDSKINATNSQKLINQLATVLDDVANKCKLLKEIYNSSKALNLTKLSKALRIDNSEDSIAQLLKICKETAPKTSDPDYPFTRKFHKSSKNATNASNSSVNRSTISNLTSSEITNNSYLQANSTSNHSLANTNKNRTHQLISNNLNNASLSPQLTNNSNVSSNSSNKSSLISNISSNCTKNETNTKSSPTSIQNNLSRNILTNNTNIENKALRNFSVNNLNFQNFTVPRVYKNDIVTIEKGVYKLNSYLIIG